MNVRQETTRKARYQTARETYLIAWRWRRAVESELRSLGLTFTQWLVLEATQHQVQTHEDAVSQSLVAERTELDRTTTSQVMRALEKVGLVDRRPEFGGPAYRVLVTRKGQRVLEQAHERIDGLPS